MESTELNDDSVATRTQRAYERSRWKLAALGFAPVLLLPSVVLCVDGVTLRTLALGLALFAAGVFVLWRGRAAARGVLPGVLVGLIPFTAALCAPHMHACSGDSCMTLCLEACAGGGFAAGLIVGLSFRRSRRDLATLAVAALLAGMTGALGCACVGYGGVLGMAAGFGLGVLPSLGRAKDRRADGAGH